MIPFNRPHTTGAEFGLIQKAIENGHLSGNGPFGRACAERLETLTGAGRALMTHSATAALEMAVILADVGPGDEVIVPSFTFVSTANAVALRGGVPVFVDVREDTLNLDERLLEAAVTERTRAVIPVHYAGVGCELDEIAAVALRHGLAVIEDAAQGILATYRGRPLGSFGELAALSFHETKNVHCGEGGALLVSAAGLVARAEVVHEKGTDRSRFFRGEVDRYTWVDLGSSYPLSEINAAFLLAQLDEAERITERRLEIWRAYHEGLAEAERDGLLRRPVVPDECSHNAHMYYVLLPGLESRTQFIAGLAEEGVHAVFHYVPLHTSTAGRRLGRPAGPLPVTESVADRLVRLPLWPGLTGGDVDRVIEAVYRVLARSRSVLDRH
jgi:dTDP-4-amino-4,6-dideoxygalactose transaminase